MSTLSRSPSRLGGCPNRRCCREWQLGFWTLAAATILAQADESQRSAPAGASAVEAGRTDLYGDPLPRGAVARMGTMRFYMGTEIGSISFAPDGKTLATAAAATDSSLPIWEADTGRVVRTLPTPG